MLEISVLMCVYNTPVNYLRESVESILNQSFQDFEFVIIDDGSDDENVSSFLYEISKNDKIIVHRNSQNIGLTRSLNIGIELCQGAFIARMDADDVAEPTRLEKQLMYMKSHKDVCVLGTNVYQITEARASLPQYVDYSNNQELYVIKMLFHNVGPVHPSSMIRLSFLNEKGIVYREDVVKSQDYALWLDCIDAGGRIACLDEKLLGYRVHKDQITLKSKHEQNYYMDNISSNRIEKLFNIDTAHSKLLADFFNNRYVESPKEYIESIKLLLYENNNSKVCDARLLCSEIKVRWIHKVIKCAIKNKDFRGLKYVYTYKCIFSRSSLIWFRNTVLRKA